MTTEALIAVATGVLLTGLAGLQAWTLKNLVDMKVQLSDLNGKLAVMLQRISDLKCQRSGRCDE